MSYFTLTLVFYLSCLRRLYASPVACLHICKLSIGSPLFASPPLPSASEGKIKNIMSNANNEYDVIIVGAGISGINAAYRIQTECPGTTYTIIESRGGMGGTWDFFKYPGLRSDSDLHTFGFPWRPWQEQKSIADGPSICKYINETAEMYGIDKHIEYHHRLNKMNWSSDAQHWRMSVTSGEKEKTYYGKFIIMSTGYYDYKNALPTVIPGLENFKGTVVHPQFWPEDLDYTGKKMVVIGSGATAVTLLPVLAQKAGKVTMLQRSPGYLINLPQKDLLHTVSSYIFPDWLTFKLVRWKFLILPWIFFNFCRAYPNAARWILQKRTAAELPKNIPHDPHFKPSYNPWEQRLCVAPDGDIFKSLHHGVADVATGRIKTVTDSSVVLESGQQLDADIIVTATGLKIQFAGGCDVSVDNKPLHLYEKYLWKGMMLQDLPNAAFVIGYTNASWTLGADATALGVCRMLKTMVKDGATSITPTLEDESSIKEMPVLNLNSTYVKVAGNQLPRAGDKAPWKARANYFTDLYTAKYGDLTTGLKVVKASS